MLNCCLSNLLLLAAIGCVYSTEFAGIYNITCHIEYDILYIIYYYDNIIYIIYYDNILYIIFHTIYNIS